MTELIGLSAVELSGMIRRGYVSCVDAAKAHLDQIGGHNRGLNAIVTQDGFGALQRARRLDDERTVGINQGLLRGVPFTVKDFFNTMGILTTCGCPQLRDNIPNMDSVAVARLKADGAVMLGKTNLSMFGGTVDSDNLIFGHPNNPYNPECTTGGSSGGSAAAVASMMSVFDLTGDMAGSTRVPAHFCGVYGLKPTGGRIPTEGIRASFRDVKRPEVWDFFVGEFATAGPIARSAADLRLLFKVLAGDLSEPPVRELGEMKFAFSRSLGDVPVDSQTQQQFEYFLRRLEENGATLVEVPQDQINIAEAQEAAASLVAGFMSYGIGPLALFIRKYGLSHLPVPNGPGQAIMRGILKGTAVSRTAAGFQDLMNKRINFTGLLDNFLLGYDAWLMPAFPVPAFPHQKGITHGAFDDPFKAKIDIDGTKASWLAAQMAYCIPFNFSGNPAVSIPAMTSSDGMPMGVQIVGRRWTDMGLLAVCERIEEVTGGFRRPAGY